MSSPWEASDEENVEDGDDSLQTEYESQKDGIIAVIDARTNMFRKTAAGEIPFVASLNVIKTIMRDKTIHSESDLIGVILFGTREKKNISDFENIYELVPFDQPTADAIRQLQSMIADPDIFEEKCGPADAETVCPLGNALWSCGITFSNAKSLKKNDYHRIWIFTNDDDPFKGRPTDRTRAIQQAEDHKQLGRDLSLWHMNPKKGVAFDVSKFYSSIISSSEDNNGEEELNVAGAGDGNFEDFIERTRAKLHKKRRVETRWMCEDTAEYLSSNQVKTYQQLGDERVYITKQEVNAIKEIGDPGLKLLGFYPLFALKDYYNLRSPYFLYPDEDAIKGSTTAFIALQQSMLKRKVFAFATMIPRTNTTMKLVALLPQAEIRDELDNQREPPGFYVITLPWADDIRQLNVEQYATAEEEDVNVASKMVTAYKLKKFQSTSFENPVIQKFWALLQAMALEEEEIDFDDEEGDLIKPRPDEELGAILPKIENFVARFGGFEKKDTKRRREPAVKDEDAEEEHKPGRGRGRGAGRGRGRGAKAAARGRAKRGRKS